MRRNINTNQIRCKWYCGITSCFWNKRLAVEINIRIGIRDMLIAPPLHFLELVSTLKYWSHQSVYFLLCGLLMESSPYYVDMVL